MIEFSAPEMHAIEEALVLSLMDADKQSEDAIRALARVRKALHMKPSSIDEVRTWMQESRAMYLANREAGA